MADAGGGLHSWSGGIERTDGLRRGDSARGLGPGYEHARLRVDSLGSGSRRAAATSIQLALAVLIVEARGQMV